MQQTIVTISPKSQVVIPKKVRKIASELKPHKRVAVRALSPYSVIVEVPPKDWTSETYGMHKKIWEGVDATEYIRRLREEWENNIR